MSHEIKAGYCLSWNGISGVRGQIEIPRTREWTKDVVIENEYKETSTYIGRRTIDGVSHSVFFVGVYRGLERFIAQAIA